MSKVILISGKARHGKDTLGNLIVDRLSEQGKTAVIYHLGDNVKHVAAKYYGWDGRKDDKGRSLLQNIGTDKARAIDPDIWIKLSQLILSILQADFDYIIIPDVRFNNEVNLLVEQFNATTVRIIRPNFDSGLTQDQLNHPSETQLDDYTAWNFVIENKGSITDLSVYVDDILNY